MRVPLTKEFEARIKFLEDAIERIKTTLVTHKLPKSAVLVLEERRFCFEAELRFLDTAVMVK